MRRERFETLADAFGGDVARWPAMERDAAAALMAAEPAWAERVLAQAGALDAALDGDAAPQGSADLVGRILMDAPKRRTPRWIGWLLPAGMGAGLAAACAAGVLAGVHLSPTPSPDAAGPTVVAASEDDVLLGVLDEDDFSLFVEEDA